MARLFCPLAGLFGRGGARGDFAHVKLSQPCARGTFYRTSPQNNIDGKVHGSCMDEWVDGRRGGTRKPETGALTKCCA